MHHELRYEAAYSATHHAAALTRVDPHDPIVLKCRPMFLVQYGLVVMLKAATEYYEAASALIRPF